MHTLTLMSATCLVVSVACTPVSYLDIHSKAKARSASTDAQQRQACTDNCEYKITGKSTPTINAAMQKKFLIDFLKNKRYQYAYALFSYSGWANVGQIMIMTDKNANGRIIYYPPNNTSYSITAKFSRKQFITDMMPKFKFFSSLPDYTPEVLDGLEYEYLRAERVNAKTATVHDRVYMRIPHTSRNQKYNLLISSFNKFKDSLLPAKKHRKTL